MATGSNGGTFALQLNGQPAGMLSAIEPAAVTLPPAASARAARRVKLGDFAATLAPVGTSAALDWMLAPLQDAPAAAAPADGAVLFGDAVLRARRRIDFTRALVTELRFAPLDATEPGRAVTIDFQWRAGGLAFSAASGSLPRPPAKSRPWLTSNFRVQGLPFGSRFVGRVLLPAVSAALVGGTRGGMPRYGRVTLGELGLEFASAGSPDLLDYVSRIVADGKLGNDEFLDLSIELLDPSFSTVLASVALKRCGLLALRQPRESSADASAKRFTLAFSVERMALAVA